MIRASILKRETCFVAVSAPPSTSPSPSTTEIVKKGEILKRIFAVVFAMIEYNKS